MYSTFQSMSKHTLNRLMTGAVNRNVAYLNLKEIQQCAFHQQWLKPVNLNK